MRNVVLAVVFISLTRHLLPPLVAADEPQYPPVLVATTDPLTPEEQAKRFHLPPGFAIQLVACEPQIHKPMNLNFDARGRLFVTSSLEYPYPARGDQPRRDGVQMLIDADGDGWAEIVRDVVGHLNIPIGVIPVGNRLIFYSIPNIYEQSPERPGRVLYREFGFRDTHGMASSFTRWIDGWIYCCHGFSNSSEVSGADGHKVSMQSGNTFRMRADGSHVEQFTHGQVNPFGLAFDPLGNMFSSDCHTLPIYQLLRGGWYPSFGKPHDGLGYGPTMIEHNHGSTGIAGVVYYAADHFPPEYRDTVFIGNPVTGRVNHDRLDTHGSTYVAIEQPDFISCDDPWFRPVDLKLGPDGALYIADFYNRIIGHYEVPLTHPGRDRERGRIWRVVYTGEPDKAPAPLKTPDLTGLETGELVELLGSENLTLRVLATEQLASRNENAIGAELLTAADATAQDSAQRAHGLWVYERLTGLDDRLVERLANDPSRLVRVHLVKALAERPEWTESPLNVATLVRGKLDDPDAFVRRAAADALGRHPNAANLAPLLALWHATPPEDTHLTHVARMALRDTLLSPGAYERAKSLLADRADWAPRLADVSLGAPTPDAAAFLLETLRSDSVGADQRPLCQYHVARHLPDDSLPDLYAVTQRHASLGLAEQREALLAFNRAAQERGQALPASVREWAHACGQALLTTDRAPDAQGGIELARELKLTDLHVELAALANPGARFDDLRAAALDACASNDPERSLPLLRQILSGVDEPLVLRQRAAGALAGLRFTEAQEELVSQLRTASDRLAVEIASGLAIRAEGGERLLAEVAAGKASALLLQEQVVRERLRTSGVPDLDARLAALTADLPPGDERLRQLVVARRDLYGQAPRDPELGQKVYQKICAACHRLDGKGAKIGPDLDGVGLRGLERLMEDTLEPSRNVDQAFRSTVLTTTDGRTLSGLLLREEGEVLILADAQGKEARIPLADVDERVLSSLSPMPANVADLVPEGDYLNLLSYLLEQRQPPPAAESPK